MVEFGIDAMCKLLVNRYMLKIDISQKIGIEIYWGTMFALKSVWAKVG